MNKEKIQEQLVKFIQTKEVGSLLRAALLHPRLPDGMSYNPKFEVSVTSTGGLDINVNGVETNGTTGHFKQYYYIQEKDGTVRSNTELKN